MAEHRIGLKELEHREEFIHRHIGPSPADIQKMLGTFGLASLDALVGKAIPANIRMAGELKLPPPRPEHETLEYARELAGRNKLYRSFIGMGYSGCHVPGVILRNILENPGWYTAYTPYQAEISQGRMEALLNFQTMVCDLTGLGIANASLLDEGTAAAEAMHLCHAVSERSGADVFWVSDRVHPQTIEVVRTRAEPLGITVIVDKLENLSRATNLFGVLLQYPDTQGVVVDLSATIEAAHGQGALVVVATDLLALTLLKSPGELGADVAVGNAQRFGVPFGYGGPHAAFLATRDAYKRSMPGRLIGVSRDARGRPGLRLALQTREQHIRREKATSNICTAQVLLAVMSSMYAVYHGPRGLKRIAERTHRLGSLLGRGLSELGFKLAVGAAGKPAFFDTLAVTVGDGKVAEFLARAREQHMNLRRIDGATVGVALDETTTREQVLALLAVFGNGRKDFPLERWDAEVDSSIPAALRRTSTFLTHPVFNSYHSETDMLRYIHRLERRDLSLTSSMIPLGSCTMKLNATSEMIPVTMAGFGQVHPFAPLDQAEGYQKIIHELETQLAEITGFNAVSLQPNAGSQGEYAGLLVIRKYHQSRGDGHRNVCLIPSSAHGTNPASAALAGMRVVVTACDANGNVDLADMRAKAAEHKQNLAALMVTYPSTHGVFETGITEICKIVHEHGGQVYMDGANLNALVGLCQPGKFGPDVAHMNLHKTFCIPHGGGGPGMGPIGVKEHLARFLPTHSQVPEAGPPTGISAVSAAPWGSASILLISWAYIQMMGAAGLKKATQVAILNANYIARRLREHYPVLYTGPEGWVAHECILDCRPLKQEGVEVEDIAKRLMDYGFHAPTMSFPVPGTLMIEPTESEPLAELDRFCEAMIQIRAEARVVGEGRIDAKNNPLKNAPHTQDDILRGEWNRPYTREEAAFPLPWVAENKFWPSVNRIDNAYGDRNLICSCPPIESYAEV
ncbi:MAG: aminomethyl-transferring glycine dehydrogenase [Planctomycetota bacterium]